MRLTATILAIPLLSLTCHAGEPEQKPRQTTTRVGQWNITAQKTIRVMEGTRALRLTSTGAVSLKHGKNMLKGPWDMEASAQNVETDFTRKLFILTGNPQVTDRRGEANGEVRVHTGAADSQITIGIDNLEIATKGMVTLGTKPASER